MNKQTLLALGIRIIGISVGLNFIFGVIRLVMIGFMYPAASGPSSLLSMYPRLQLQDFILVLAQAVFTFVLLKYPDRISHFLLRTQKDSAISTFERVHVIEIVLIALGLDSLINGIRFVIMSIVPYLLSEGQYISYPVILTAFIYLITSAVLLTKCAGIARWLDERVVNRFVK